VMQRRTNS